MPSTERNRLRAYEESLQAHKVSDTEYIVYNVAKGSKYSVLKDVRGIWHCTCPWAVKKSSANPDICKHLQRVLDKENGCGICGRKDIHADLKRDNIAEPYLCKTCRIDVKNAERGM